MSHQIRDAIVGELERIEREEDVRVLYACESGSRAWGFESLDSDYDVRFIYVHHPNWYLSIDDRRDVIECKCDDMLDISGWDIRKALRLLRKSNPPLLEWLRSPMVYAEQQGFAGKLRMVTDTFFSPRACLHHYLHMAEGNYREYLRCDEVRVKKYFYVLRPVLSCMWIERYGSVPPMEFETLLSGQRLEDALVRKVRSLIKRKRKGAELGVEPRVPVLNDFLDVQIARFAEYQKSVPRTAPPDSSLLDELFRQTLRDASG